MSLHRFVLAIAVTVGAVFAVRGDMPAQQEMDPPRKDLDGDPLPRGAVARFGTTRLRTGDRIRGITFSPDGKFLAAGVYGPLAYQYSIYQWDLTTYKQMLKRISPSPHDHLSCAPIALTFGPDNRLLGFDATGHDEALLYEIVTGKQLCKIEHFNGFGLPSFSSNLKMFATGGNDRTKVHDVATGRTIFQFTPTYQPAFSPGLRCLAAGSFDGKVQLLEISTGKVRRTWSGHQGQVSTVAFAPDGEHLVSGADDTTLLVWDVYQPFDKRHEKDQEWKRTELDNLWCDLGANDAQRAYEALCWLTRAGKPAVSFLEEKIKAAVDMDRLVNELVDDDPVWRREAEQAILELGNLAGPHLRQLKGKLPAVEMGKKIDRLLTTLDSRQGEPKPKGKELQIVRALEALEVIGSPEAVQSLQALTRTYLGEEAKASLERVRRHK